MSIEDKILPGTVEPADWPKVPEGSYVAVAIDPFHRGNPITFDGVIVRNDAVHFEISRRGLRGIVCFRHQIVKLSVLTLQAEPEDLRPQRTSRVNQLAGFVRYLVAKGIIPEKHIIKSVDDSWLRGYAEDYLLGERPPESGNLA